MRTAAWRARLLSASAALDIDQPELARTFLGDGQRLRKPPVELRIGAASVEARLMEAQGDRVGAGRRPGPRSACSTSTGPRWVLRRPGSHLAAHARPAAQLGMRIAVEDGDARSIFGWMERTRAGGLRFPSVRPPDDGALGRELAELRVVEGRISAAERQGSSVPELRQARIRSPGLHPTSSPAGRGRWFAEIGTGIGARCARGAWATGRWWRSARLTGGRSRSS